MLGKETHILEQWRKKYLLQAFIVALISVLVILAGISRLDFGGFKLILILAVLVVFYLMIKSLQEDLQTRGEGLVLAKGNILFNHLSFDYGKGIADNALHNQEMVAPYKSRECKNVMSGQRFLIEEDWLYTAVSKKFLTVYNTSFRGVILEISAGNLPSSFSGEISKAKGRLLPVGGGSVLLKKYGLEKDMAALLDLFAANKVKLFVYQGKIYFWIRSEAKIFYQFSLFKVNSIGNFVKRTEKMQKLILNFVKVFANE